MNNQTYPYSCPQCGRIKNYVRFASYQSAISQSRLCADCQLEEWIDTHPANYNPKACEFFDQLAEYSGYTFRHAKNGGEMRIGLYRVDCYVPELHTVIEYDEPYHAEREQQAKDRMRTNAILGTLQTSGITHCYILRYFEALHRFRCVGAIHDGKIYGDKKIIFCDHAQYLTALLQGFIDPNVILAYRYEPCGLVPIFDCSKL